MKKTQLIQTVRELILEGFDQEIPVSLLKSKLAPFCGYDKFKLKYLLETIIECGYFEYTNTGKTTLKLNNGWYK